MTKDVQDAVVILNRACILIETDPRGIPQGSAWGYQAVLHAIQHLSRPDRSVYPKVRGSRKGNPVRRLAR